MSTMLDAYMAANGLKDAEFASQIGRERSVVSKLRRGRIKPTLELAATIEAKTDGAVPMKAWLAEEVNVPADAQEAA